MENPFPTRLGLLAEFSFLWLQDEDPYFGVFVVVGCQGDAPSALGLFVSLADSPFLSEPARELSPSQQYF